MVLLNAHDLCSQAVLQPPLANHPTWANAAIPFGVSGSDNDAGTDWTEFENDICPFFCPKAGLESCDPAVYSLVCDLDGGGMFVDPSAMLTFTYQEVILPAPTTPATYRGHIFSINPDVLGSIPGEVSFQCKLAGTHFASTVYSDEFTI